MSTHSTAAMRSTLASIRSASRRRWTRAARGAERGPGGERRRRRRRRRDRRSRRRRARPRRAATSRAASDPRTSPALATRRPPMKWSTETSTPATRTRGCSGASAAIKPSVRRSPSFDWSSTVYANVKRKPLPMRTGASAVCSSLGARNSSSEAEPSQISEVERSRLTRTRQLVHRGPVVQPGVEAREVAHVDELRRVVRRARVA